MLNYFCCQFNLLFRILKIRYLILIPRTLELMQLYKAGYIATSKDYGKKKSGEYSFIAVCNLCHMHCSLPKLSPSQAYDIADNNSRAVLATAGFFPNPEAPRTYSKFDPTDPRISTCMSTTVIAVPCASPLS
jgi:hypothetical protein